MQLERLYKKSKTDAIVICDIFTSGSKITVRTGQLNGKMQEHDTVCISMNIGRSNETSADEQANKEALAKHVKKIKAGYTLDPSGNIVVRLPQKVKKYQDQKSNIIFPCWLSPKLNGLNGEFRNEETLGLFSRGGDNYPVPEHLKKPILDLMESFETCTLNGELYKHGEYLQDITSAVKKPNIMSPDLEFHVFEIPDNRDSFIDKIEILEREGYVGSVKKVKILRAESHEDIEEYLKECLVLKYEGIVIRNSKGVYEYNQRSSDVFKYKLPQDAEYKIIGYNIDKKGHPVFICQAEKGTFKVKLKGDDEHRKKVASEADTWIGKWLNIEFEELSKDQNPLKPVGIGLRNCDDHGNPLE